MLRSLQIWMLLSLVGFPGTVAARGLEDHPHVVVSVVNVSVVNDAGIDEQVLQHAEKLASRIYQQAGLSIAWNNCPILSDMVAGHCIQSVDSHDLVLRIEHHSRTLSDDAYGVAFLGVNGSGAYCDVFYDRIADLHRRGRASEAIILGIVAAHELGHLLLGSHSHSATGIMRAQFPEREFWMPETGLAALSHQQMRQIADRLERN